MKNIALYCFILALLMTATACSHEDFLEEEVFSAFTAANLYNDAETAETAVNGLYAQFEADNNWMARRFWVLTEMPSPAVMSDAGLNDRRQLIDRWAWEPQNVVIETIHNRMYQKINRVNAVLDNLEDLEEDVQRPSGYNWPDRLRAEASFLRALYNYWIVNIWGDAPLRTDEFKPGQDEALANTPASEIFALIISDLESAIPNLPEWTEYGPTDEARVSKGAARALLAKAYLTRAVVDNNTLAQPNDLQNALAQIQAMEAAGVHGLADNFADLWYFNNPNGSENYASLNYEILLDIQYSADVGLQGDSNPVWSPDESGFGTTDWGNFTVEYPFFTMFSDDDERKEGTFVLEYERNGETVRYDAADPNGDDYREESPGIKKWIDNITELRGFDEPNMVLLRYADVILMKAEVLNEQNNGPNAEAYAALNQIRNRAGLPNLTEGLTYTQFKDSLYIDRTKELLLEGHGYFDVQRFWDVATPYVHSSSVFSVNANDGGFVLPDGTTTKVSDLGPLTVINPEEKYRHMPFPEIAMTTNPLLRQPPGWGDSDN
jgi:hypothetical protein